jgi:hypothetical protein
LKLVEYDSPSAQSRLHALRALPAKGAYLSNLSA